MDITAILSAITNLGPAVAYGATIVLSLWLRQEKKEKDNWKKRYLKLRKERDEEIDQRKIEQNNTIDLLKSLYENK